MNNNQTFVCSIEGNIGVGKGAFLNMLKHHFESNYTCFKKEPTHKWKNTNPFQDCDFNLLDNFYSDTSRWSFTTQIKCTTTRIQEYEKINKNIAFCERSWYTDRFVFVETLNSLNLLSDLEKNIYDDYYRWATSKINDVDAIIYLRASPDVCFSRSMNKHKHEEIGVSFKYLEKLHDVHEEWLMKKSNGIPILIIDVEEDFEDIEHRQNEIINQITREFNFLEKYLIGRHTEEEKLSGNSKKQNWSIVKNKKVKRKKNK
tara:strand:+ start:3850 stop:4626 length:777 start_codon:yes stop_codon:yes gene_type:complete